ncbi:TPA: hypothetical protein PMC50_002508 [Vibrio cholerae]|nr:hypothetical protein [Vibrio cholerae]
MAIKLKIEKRLPFTVGSVESKSAKVHYIASSGLLEQQVDTDRKEVTKLTQEVREAHTCIHADKKAANDSSISASNSAKAAKTSETNASSSATKAQGHDTAAKASADKAKVSETNAKASETASKTSESNAATSASTATTQANKATTEASKATTKATEALNSANSALASKNEATTQATKATTEATKADASAKAAKVSETASKASESASKASETKANTSATLATTKASEASTSASTASAKATESSRSAANARASELAAAESERKAAVSAAALTGAMIEAGSCDLSSGVAPTPIKDTNGQNRSCFWKVTKGGTVSGESYGVGDSIVYSVSLNAYYKIDNTESVTSVNNKQGVVNLSATDVGALPVNKDGSVDPLTVRSSVSTRGSAGTNPITLYKDVNDIRRGSVEWNRNSDVLRLSKFDTEGVLQNYLEVTDTKTTSSKPLFDGNDRVYSAGNLPNKLTVDPNNRPNVESPLLWQNTDGTIGGNTDYLRYNPQTGDLRTPTGYMYASQGFYHGGQLCYSPLNKPTAADVGALPVVDGRAVGTIGLSFNNPQQLIGDPYTTLSSLQLLPTQGAGFNYSLFKQEEAGLFPNISNANGILSFNTHEGQYNHQFGLSSNGRMYHRSRHATDGVSPWAAIYTEANKPSASDVGALPVNTDGSVDALSVRRAVEITGTEGSNPIVVLNDASGTRRSSVEWNRNSNVLRLSKFNTESSLQNYLEVTDTTTVSNKPLYEGSSRVYSPSNKPTAADIGALGVNALAKGQRKYEIGSTHNLNNFTDGDYVLTINSSSSIPVNAPSGARSGTCFAGSASQIYVDRDNRMWHRTKIADVWNAWVELYSTSKKPSAADVGTYTKAEVDTRVDTKFNKSGGAVSGTVDATGFIQSRSFINGVGGIQDNGSRVYSPRNKPSASDVGTYTKAEIDAKTQGIKVKGLYLTMSEANPKDELGYGTWQLLTGDASLSFGDGTAQSGAVTGDNTPLVPVPAHSHTASQAAHSHNRGNMEIAGEISGMSDQGHRSQVLNWGEGAFYIDRAGTSQSLPGHYGHRQGGGRAVFRASRSWTGNTSSTAPAVTVNSTGTASARIDVRGARIKVNVWMRVS